jgi:hypothetical protein
VTTYAGNPSRPGSADGPLASATFTAPIALAYDAQGDLYVADYGVGLRKIGRDGTVSTISVPAPYASAHVTGLSAVTDWGQTRLYCATLDRGTLVLSGGTFLGHYSAGTPANDGKNVFIQGARWSGYAYAVAAQPGTNFVYTDIRSSVVRVMAFGRTYIAAGEDSENSSFDGANFADGAGTTARFNTPMGIVGLPGGSYAIADTGNRRIRVMGPVDFSLTTSPEMLQGAGDAYRIVYVGNSIVSYNQNWDESVSGIIESRLDEDWNSLGFPKRPRVFPVQLIAKLSAIKTWIETYPASGLAEMVIWQINSGEIDDEPVAGSRSAREVTGTLRELAAELRAKSIPLVVSVNALSYEVSPVEDLWFVMRAHLADEPYVFPPDERAEMTEPYPHVPSRAAMLEKAVAAAGVQVIDALPQFSETEMQSSHPALFAGNDDHWSRQGTLLAAHTICDALLRLRPWKH